jgi:hypothetical protein
MPSLIIPRTGVITPQRPAWPVLNTASTLAIGLVSMFAAPNTLDLVTGVTYSGTYAEAGWPGIGGTGLRCNAVDQGIRRLAPRNVMILRPFTIAAHVVFTNTPDVNATIFGVTFNTAGTTPFIGLSVGIDAAGNFVGNYNNAAASLLQVVAAATPPLLGVMYSVVFTNTVGAQAIYINGRKAGTGVNAQGGPSYGVGPIIGAGELTVNSRNPNLIFFDGMIWNRVLTPTEISFLSVVSPWDLYAPDTLPLPLPSSRFLSRLALMGAG